MGESDASEFTSPAESEWSGADVGQTFIAAGFSSLVAFIREFPSTISRMSAIWFTNDLLKSYLVGRESQI